MALPDFAPRVPRYQIEEWVNYLIAKYPATFFTGAGKRPLKKTILDDLKSEQALDDEKLEIALTFYMRDWQYQGCLQAGAERIDLNGKKAGVVTEREASEAQRQIYEEKQNLKAKREIERRDAIAVVNQLHLGRQIPTDQLRKIDAPVSRKVKTRGAMLARLEAVLSSASSILSTEDEVLRSELLKASLKVLISEAEKIIATLEANPSEQSSR
jgi:sRNA-binding protein